METSKISHFIDFATHWSFFHKKVEFDCFSAAYAFFMPFFERYRSLFCWNDISYETTEKTASFRAKKQKSQKMEFDNYAPRFFKWEKSS